ncbi:MAG: lysine--tRNA ligase [bacterium]|nr:lysine--tRNA ligase [bacterium]
MFWADRIADQIRDTRKPKDGARFVIRDEKTLSGRVHIGSMRGVAIHGLIGEVLSEYGVSNVYKYELNDLDPFDTAPAYLDQAKFKEHLGKPLYIVPSPEPDFANYAEYFGADFMSVHKKAGFTPEYYRTTVLYQSGKMDLFIKLALERATDIRRILKDVSGSEKDAAWLPVSVVCEKCGKIMTTRAFGWDGETVEYACDRSPDECVPCGHTGRINPFKGGSKLFWKVDWAAKWAAVGVDIEGGGKDHSTKGGARDVANHIAKEIFDIEPPFDIPYEFFLVGGAKMSSSKGRGSSAKEMSELFTPQVLRLVLIGKDIKEQINVDPSGDSIPRTYDWYDDLAEGVREGKSDDYARLYALCQLPEDRAELGVPWQMRFRDVAFIIQMPHLSLKDEAQKAKGVDLTDDESRALSERAQYAKFWLATYAPAEFRYELQQTIPTVDLSDVQKKALAALADFIEEGLPGQGNPTAEEIHARLHELKSEIPIEPKELFTAIYGIFLNRTSGPKAGWFLSVLPRDFLLSRLRESAQ